MNREDRETQACRLALDDIHIPQAIDAQTVKCGTRKGQHMNWL